MILHTEILKFEEKTERLRIKSNVCNTGTMFVSCKYCSVCIAARNRSINVFKKTIETAAELEADTIVTLCGYGTIDEKDEDVWKRSVDS